MVYDEPMRQLLHFLKYQRKTSLQYLFADLISEFLDRYHIPIGTFDHLIAVPIHPAKYREREFNQAQLITELLAKKYKVRILSDHLLRSRNTEPQAFLEEKERCTNVQGAFRIRHSCDVENKSVLIIDDLMTTGATACAAARACKQAGASYVGILTLAIGQ